MYTKQEAYAKIEELVQHFSRDRVALLSSGSDATNETQTRREFIDPFFEALGWDVSNRNHSAPQYREVLHEDKVVVKGSTKAPDYSFRLSGGQRLFFVEAKQPKVSLKDNTAPALQLRSYGWSANLDVSILTDFEEFIVYDCSIQPRANDKADKARIQYLRYDQYLSKFDELWNTFSKQAVLQGSFDAFRKNKKRGQETVDKKFLESLDEWRKSLAEDIARQNKSLDEEQMNAAVQTLLDRIIFLRIAEDRGLEDYEKLKLTIERKGNEKKPYYQKLLNQFAEADNKYNSGLFNLSDDTLSQSLEVSDKVLNNIINQLYFPHSPYQFDVISVEILGRAYEQFLGKSISLSKSHKAEVEYKPEVRKAGGVYYTPEYIVQYIVQNTVGKLCEGKTPAQVAALRICDPACGSGSFLLGAYEFLLNWHRDYYTQHPTEKFLYSPYAPTANTTANTKAGAKASKKATQTLSPLTPDGNLISQLKKQILLNNIYGVDIDPQAVEVSKLSLLLKCLEGETPASSQQSLVLERILPSLENNIKCGNSLVDVDFYEGQIDFDPAAEKKIKPFNWKYEFPQVFANGGFDAVIGNPPWGADLHIDTHSYLMQHFKAVPSKTKDSYMYFTLKALVISKKEGFIGYLLANTWLLINNAKEFRREVLNYEVEEIIDYGDGVFEDATVESSLLILRNQNKTKKQVKTKRYKKGKVESELLVNPAQWLNDTYVRIIVDRDDKTERLLNRLSSTNTPFDKTCLIIWGIKPYQVGYGDPPQTKEILEKRVYHSDTRISKEWKPLLVGSNVNRYETNTTKIQYIKYGKWLMYSSNEHIMLSPKIMLRQTADRIRANYDDQQYYCQNSIFLISSDSCDLFCLLGVLNSSLFNFIYQKNNPQQGKVFAEIKPSVIKQLPITPKIQLSSNDPLKNSLLNCVSTMLQLHKQKQSANAAELRQIEARIAYTDERINALVYELYNLSPEEIAIVEGRN